MRISFGRLCFKKIAGLKKRSGVAEIVGEMLLVAMTVTLFAGIAVWVSTQQTPTLTNVYRHFINF